MLSGRSFLRLFVSFSDSSPTCTFSPSPGFGGLKTLKAIEWSALELFTGFDNVLKRHFHDSFTSTQQTSTIRYLKWPLRINCAGKFVGSVSKERKRNQLLLFATMTRVIVLALISNTKSEKCSSGCCLGWGECVILNHFSCVSWVFKSARRSLLSLLGTLQFTTLGVN